MTAVTEDLSRTLQKVRRATRGPTIRRLAPLLAPLLTLGCAPTIDHHSSVVATGEHCEEDAGGCRSPLLVSNEGDLSAALTSWGYDNEAVEGVSTPLLFFGAIETGNCKIEIEDVRFDSSSVQVTTQTFHVQRFQNDCVTDAIPRSFIIQVPADREPVSLLVNGQSVVLRAQ